MILLMLLFVLIFVCCSWGWWREQWRMTTTGIEWMSATIQQWWAEEFEDVEDIEYEKTIKIQRWIIDGDAYGGSRHRCHDQQHTSLIMINLSHIDISHWNDMDAWWRIELDGGVTAMNGWGYRWLKQRCRWHQIGIDLDDGMIMKENALGANDAVRIVIWSATHDQSQTHPLCMSRDVVMVWSCSLLVLYVSMVWLSVCVYGSWQSTSESSQA